MPKRVQKQVPLQSAPAVTKASTCKSSMEGQTPEAKAQPAKKRTLNQRPGNIPKRTRTPKPGTTAEQGTVAEDTHVWEWLLFQNHSKKEISV